MKNKYEVRGDVTVIFLERNGKPFKETIIDTDDLPKLLEFDVNWNALINSRSQKYYVRTSRYLGGGRANPKFTSISMHRYLTSAPDGVVVDHYDGNPLNNRKSNLNIVTVAENNINTGLRKNNKSGVRGVWWCKTHKKWIARVKHNRKLVLHKYFQNFDDAVQAVEEARRLYHSYAFKTGSD